MKEKITVKVSDIVFPRPGQEGNWYILRTDACVCKGNISWRPTPGEMLTLTGEWGVYRGNREFKFSEAAFYAPTDEHAQLQYAVELTKGLGEAAAQKIWDTLGEKWRDISADDKLIRPAQLNALRETIDRLRTEKDKTDVCAWLMGMGATRLMAEAAWSKWKKASVGRVQNNCYILCDLPRYGFKIVDERFRPHFDIADKDPRRIRAAVLYAVGQLTDRGDTIFPWSDIEDAVRRLVGYAGRILNLCVAEMLADGELAAIADKHLISRAADHNNDTIIWKYANGL